MTRAARTVCRELADCLELAPQDVEWAEHAKRWLMLLAPSPRKRKSVSQGTKERRATVRELDALCREVVFLRDGGKCRKCGRESGLMDWSHVYSRKYRWLRHDPMNSCVLCRNCHMNFWHHRPMEATVWFRHEFGEKVHRTLVLRAARPQKSDPRLVKEFLLKEKERLKGASE